MTAFVATTQKVIRISYVPCLANTHLEMNDRILLETINHANSQMSSISNYINFNVTLETKRSTYVCSLGIYQTVNDTQIPLDHNVGN